MNREVLDYIAQQRTCVVAVEMLDGSPHAATVHFAHKDKPFVLIIQTSPNYRKTEPLFKNQSTRVSVVIGTTEEPSGKDKTFQLDGEAQIIESGTELTELYLEKFPEKRSKWLKDVFFKVTPLWWRYTDWGNSNGKAIFNSDGTILVNGNVIEHTE